MQLPHNHPTSQPTTRSSPFAAAVSGLQSNTQNDTPMLNDGISNPNISHSVIPDPSNFDPSFYHGAGTFYVVTSGGVLGIFDNWDNAKSASSGYSGGSAIHFGSWDDAFAYYNQVWEADNCQFTHATPRKKVRQGSAPPPSPTTPHRGGTPATPTLPITPRRAATPATPMVPTSPTTPRRGATPVVFPQSPTTPRFTKPAITSHHEKTPIPLVFSSISPRRGLPGYPDNPIVVPSPTPTPGRAENPIVVSSAASSPASIRGTSPIVFTSPVPTRSLVRPTSKLAPSSSTTHRTSAGTQTHPVFILSPLSPRATTIPIRVTGVISKSDLDAQITNALVTNAPTVSNSNDGDYYEDIDEEELIAMCKATEEAEAKLSSRPNTAPLA